MAKNKEWEKEMMKWRKKDIINLLEKVIKEGENHQTSDKPSLNIGDVVPILKDVHNILEDFDFDNEDEKEQNTVCDIVEMCEAIHEDYYMYKRR